MKYLRYAPTAAVTVLALTMAAMIMVEMPAVLFWVFIAAVVISYLAANQRR